MISEECFSREYMREQCATLEIGESRIVQVEKSIHALALLGHLTKTDLSFIFKGGTSLLLHLPRIKRLSIDVDIMSDASDKDLEEIIDQISVLPPFIRYEKQNRGERGQPERRHFKLFYKSAIENQERNILLDVVPQNGCNLTCIEKPINTEFISVKEEVLVTLPIMEALLGDKLTAFAPHTIGVKWLGADDRSMAMQVVKQLFDVGELFNEVQNLDAVRDAYLESYRLENDWRGGNHLVQDVLVDTKNVALQLCCLGLDYESEDAVIIGYLQKGITRLRNHLIRDPFRENNEAKIAAAKVYLLASYLEGSIDLTADQLSFDLDTQRDFIQTTNITDPSCLNRLKPILPEAFYYLALAFGASVTEIALVEGN